MVSTSASILKTSFTYVTGPFFKDTESKSPFRSKNMYGSMPISQMISLVSDVSPV